MNCSAQLVSVPMSVPPLRPLPPQILAWKAILARDFTALADLCQQGVIVNGRYPLLAEAVRRGCPIKMIELLIAKKVNINRSGRYRSTALTEAVSQGNQLLLEVLLRAGANVNVADRIGRTALMTAAFDGNLEIVKRLLAAGADLNLRDVHGRTAWGLAKIGPQVGERHQIEICKTLARSGARL